MHTKEIKVFCIAQTRMNRQQTREWLDHLGATEYPVPKAEEVTDAGAVCGLCAKRCYMSFEPGLNPNVTRVRKVWHDYLANILKSGHGSVTEHASWTFAIEGVSRVFTGEMNRHRAGVAISEGSMRYIRFDDIGFWMPKSLEEGNYMLMPMSKCYCNMSERADCTDCKGTGKLPQLTDPEFERCKEMTRVTFETAFEDMEDNYKRLCEIWNIENLKDFGIKKKLTSMFRRIVGMGVATGGTWTLNTRALRHVIALRTSEHAEEEIAHVMGLIGKYMFENEPDLFGDFVQDEATGAWIPANVKV
jgi:thymidylate synthase (FAD)